MDGFGGASPLNYTTREVGRACVKIKFRTVFTFPFVSFELDAQLQKRAVSVWRGLGLSR